MYDLTTQSTGSAQNIYAATVELATFTASADCVLSPAVRLSALANSAANLTVGYRHKTSGSTLIGEWVEQFAKPVTTSTVATSQLPLVRLANGEKLVVTAKSSNSGDTTAAFAIDWPGELLAEVTVPSASENATEIASVLATAHGAGSWEGGGGAGTGARTVTVTVTDGTDPLEGATVRATKGAETKVLLTNASGVAALPLDDGTWTLAITLAGYDGSTESLVVSADAAITRELTLQAITPPASSGVSTGVLTVYDTAGVVESGVTVTVRIKTGPGTAGLGYDGADRTATSNGSGLVQFAGLIRGASYAARRGDGRWVEFTVPDEDSFNLPEIIGSA